MTSAVPSALRTLLMALPVVLLVSFSTSLHAASTAEEMYLAARAREEAARSALALPETPGPVAADARAVVAAYQEIVRLYPASGYTDNALWQAGVLSIDLFVRFGEARDRNTATRLLRLLASGYPASSRVKEVPAQLERLGLPERAPAPPAARIATITSIRRQVLNDAVRVTIELDREVNFHEERIFNPVRIFVDLAATRASAALLDKTLRFDGDADIIRQVRIGRHPNNVTRVVLDAGGVSGYSVYPLYEPYRIVIDSVREPQLIVARQPLRAVSPPAVRAITAGIAATAEANRPFARGGGAVARRTPLRSRPLTVAAAIVPPVPSHLGATPLMISRAADPPGTSGADAAAATAKGTPLPTRSLPAVTAATAPSKNVSGGYSLARQLGLSVSRIVIDPGHGGHDPGAKGKSINEAELVLDIALRVERLLENGPGIEVILTRRTDEYVPLQERTAIANREGADLFLSIHANASANASARGVETYFLNFANTMIAAEVAARENAVSGQTMGALPEYLKAIALNSKLAESREFATDVQHALVERLRKSNKALKDLGVKQAPFVVLIGASMPSVLTEISFVTNSQESKLLRSDAYRERIAEALVNAIRKYQMSLKNASRVAQQ